MRTVPTLLTLAVLLLSSCATLFKGGHQSISFSSDPGGAQVLVNGQPMGITPLQLKLESKRSYTIEFKKDGYESKAISLNNSVGAGWIVLDALGGLIPIVVDAATGNWYSLDQDHVNALLEAQQHQPPAPTAEAHPVSSM